VDSTLKSILFWFAIVVAAFAIYQYSNSRAVVAPGEGAERPVVTSESTAAQTLTPNEQRARDYVSAFNKREIATMLGMVTDDVQWLTMAGDKISVETQGKTNLRESLTAYFKSTPSARSELQWTQASASRVAALERVAWQSQTGSRSQASLCVYEFRDGLIARVYYYPVEK
jgi:hypothetical protein